MAPISPSLDTASWNPEHWQRCKEIIGSMLDHDRSSWPSLLLEQCGDDVDLFLDAACLARLSSKLGSFLEEPAVHKVLQ